MKVQWVIVTLFLSLILAPVEKVEAQEIKTSARDYCRAGINETYIGPAGTRPRIMTPSFRYNDYMYESDFTMVGTSHEMVTFYRVIEKSDFRSGELCDSTEQPVAQDIFALTSEKHGPVSSGSICVPQPKILFWGTHSIGERSLKSYIDTDLADGKKLVLDMFDAGLPRRPKSGRFTNRLSMTMEQRTIAILNLIEKQCGSLPNSLEMVGAIGSDIEMALYAPEYLLISVERVTDGWLLDYSNIERANELVVQGELEHDQLWAKDAVQMRELFERRNANLADQLIEGLAIGLAGAGKGGYFDVCNQGSTPMRVATISLIPSTNPRVFIEGFQFAAQGECARVSPDTHPLMVYGVSIERQSNSGWYEPIYSVEEPDDGIPHRFNEICVPNEDSFVRNEFGIIDSNRCKAGDKKLSIDFNVRVGNTNFTMNVN